MEMDPLIYAYNRINNIDISERPLRNDQYTPMHTTLKIHFIDI